MNSSKPINSQILAILACRTLALYALFWGLESIAFFARPLWQIFISGGTSHLIDLWIGLTHTTWTLMIFAILWFKAPWIARKMAPDQEFTVDLQALDLDSLAAVLTAIAGLIFVAFAIIDISRFIVYYMQSEAFLRLEQAVMAGTKFIGGLVLIIGNKRIAATIKAFRTWH